MIQIITNILNIRISRRHTLCGLIWRIKIKKTKLKIHPQIKCVRGQKFTQNTFIFYANILFPHSSAFLIKFF